MIYDVGYEAIINQAGAYKVTLEIRDEGVYVNVFETPSSAEPYIDMLQADLVMAKHACNIDYGIKEDQWSEIPNERWHTTD